MSSLINSCISCDTVAGRFQPPGGLIYENECWVVALRAKPVRIPCLPFIILKRHCEDVAQLSDAEAVSLGPTMQLTARVLGEVIQPAKVHFGLYAEEVKHIHIHVFPRLPSMPAGNKPNRLINRWYDWLHTLGLRTPFDDEVVAGIAVHMKDAYKRLA